MSPDFMTTAQNGGKVVGLTHWPPLPPGNQQWGGKGDNYLLNLLKPTGYVMHQQV